MKSFLAGQDVALTFDPTLTGLEPTGVEYRVVDQDGAILVARTNLPGWSSGEATVAILAAQNALPVGATAAARTVTLYVTGTGGGSAVAILEESYRIVAEERLAVPAASFLTYAGAMMVAEDMVQLAGWSIASDSQRTAALLQARQDMNLLSFHYRPEDWQSRVMGDITLSDLEEISLSEFGALEPGFRKALQRAQVLQADALLSRDDNDIAQEKGVTSIVIGESSKTFKNNRVTSRAVCSRALRVLAPYLAPMRVGRA